MKLFLAGLIFVSMCAFSYAEELVEVFEREDGSYGSISKEDNGDYIVREVPIENSSDGTTYGSGHTIKEIKEKERAVRPKPEKSESKESNFKGY